VSWKAEVTTDGHSWAGNALRFGTPEEAKGYASDLFMRWTSVRDTRVVHVEEPVTHAWRTERDQGSRLEELASSPPQPVEPNSLRAGTVIKTHDGDHGEIRDNKRGIRRIADLNGECGSIYVDRIKCALIGGRWHPVVPSKDQQRRLKSIHKALSDLR
jgi:hypothetical protein